MSAVHTVLLDFSIEQGRISDDEGREKVLAGILDVIQAKGGAAFDGLTPKAGQFIAPNVFVAVFKGILVTIRFEDSHELIALNIEYMHKEEDAQPLFSFETLRSIELAVKHSVTLRSRSKYLPAIRRGSKLDPYLTTSDERIIEYDVDKVLFEQESPFQKVQIVHTKSVGNMLVLDELQNLAEADLIYTETLMCRGVENYEGKEICILGGGDGALLYELLKEKPKHVVMLEIDEMVMVACNEHMRSVCGDVLERRKAENFEIIVGDCMEQLRGYIAAGKKFDYVFGDLTDIPISPTPTGEIWEFIKAILDASFKILKPDGKYMTHGNGVGCPESLRMYEEQLQKLEPPVEFQQSKAFVPSFMEDWVFYQVNVKRE